MQGVQLLLWMRFVIVLLSFAKANVAEGCAAFSSRTAVIGRCSDWAVAPLFTLGHTSLLF